VPDRPFLDPEVDAPERRVETPGNGADRRGLQVDVVFEERRD
jgi:hypothetical protein